MLKDEHEIDLASIYGMEAVFAYRNRENKDCDSCYGYGYYMGYDTPMVPADAYEGWSSDDCPNCGSNNEELEHYDGKVYENGATTAAAIAANAIKHREIKEPIVKTVSGTSIESALDEFDLELRCAELPDALARSELEQKTSSLMDSSN